MRGWGGVELPTVPSVQMRPHPLGQGCTQRLGGRKAVKQAKPAGADITSRASCPANVPITRGAGNCLFGRGELIGGWGVHSLALILLWMH